MKTSGEANCPLRAAPARRAPTAPVMFGAEPSGAGLEMVWPLGSFSTCIGVSSAESAPSTLRTPVSEAGSFASILGSRIARLSRAAATPLGSSLRSRKRLKYLRPLPRAVALSRSSASRPRTACGDQSSIISMAWPTRSGRNWLTPSPRKPSAVFRTRTLPPLAR